MTAQGHPRTIFKRAIERGNMTMAEATAREFALNLEEALQLALSALAELRGGEPEYAAKLLAERLRP